MVAVKKELASVVETRGGKVQSLMGNEGIIFPIQVNFKGGLPVCSWHMEILKKQGIPRTQRLIACDADMEPDAFVEGRRFDERTMNHSSPSRLYVIEGPDGVEVEQMSDYAV